MDSTMKSLDKSVKIQEILKTFYEVSRVCNFSSRIFLILLLQKVFGVIYRLHLFLYRTT